jgi:HlyD family secretion protein
MNTSNSPLPLILSLLTAGMIAVGTSTYYLVQSPSSQPSELELLTESVQEQNLTVRIEANGIIEPIQSVNISPKEPGRIVRLLAEQGQPVKQGQRLAIMENAEIQAQGVEAQARLKETIANLEQSKINIPSEINQGETDLRQAQLSYAQTRARFQETQKTIPKQIDQAQANLESAKSRLALAAKRAQRYQYLSQQGATPLDQFDEQVNEYRRAEAAVFEAQQHLEELKNTAQPQLDQLGAAVAEANIKIQKQQLILKQKKERAKTEIQKLQAQIEAAQAQLKGIEIKFLNTIITAPFDGIVTQRYANEGAFVTPTTSASSTASATSTSILALARGLQVIAKVPEVDIQQIKPGQQVEITADAYPDQVFLGQVILVAPEAIVEQNVTSFEVKIGLINGQDKLLSKMNVDVTFLGQPISNALVVPTVSIVTEDGQTGVMIPDSEGKPIFQPITIGMTINNNTQVLSGLKKGDRIFIDLPKKYRKKEEDN